MWWNSLKYHNFGGYTDPVGVGAALYPIWANETVDLPIYVRQICYVR